MGFNLKMLAERRVDQTLYYNHECHMELRECIHDHMEDFRMIYDKEDFLQLSDHWIAARAKYDALGQPVPAEQNDLLHKVTLGPERLHHDRIALEFTRGGADKDGGGDTLHFHYRNCRIHLTKADFYRMSHVFCEALRSYNQGYGETIRLSDPNVVVRDVAQDKYIPWLQEYSTGTCPKEDPDAYWDLLLEHKEALRPAEAQRPDGGWLLDQPKTRVVPEDLDRKYLYTMYECMKKYGYAKGPFAHDLVRVQAQDGNTGRLEITGSHRAACLAHLGYDEIKVVVTNR